MKKEKIKEKLKELQEKIDYEMEFEDEGCRITVRFHSISRIITSSAIERIVKFCRENDCLFYVDLDSRKLAIHNRGKEWE